jgi:hypothetical protein
MCRKIIIPDTSVMNHLVDDSEYEAIRAALNAAFVVFIPETVIGELVATTDGEKRSRLLNASRALISNGQFIHSFAVLVKNMERTFDANPQQFDWRRTPIQFHEAGSYLAHNIVSDEISEQQRLQSQTLLADWITPFRRMGEHLTNVIEERGLERPSLDEAMTGFVRDGGSFWIWARMLYWRDDRSEADEQTVRAFVEVCPPFRVMLTALLIAQYDRCFRDINLEGSLRAGRCDTLMSFFLPYCDVFLTDDIRHEALFRETIRFARVPCEVMSLEKFRASFMPSIL